MAEIGTILGGRYRLVELLGQGGMATIFRAQDSELGRDVAVKVLRPEYGRDPDFLSRFRQEAQNAASLNHPNIVAVHDFGQDPAGPYIVMELVDGEDLATIVNRSGPLPPRQTARIVAETARALQAAHERGIVHRDVKSGNVLISRDGRVKVTDFGIARALSEAQTTLPGTTLGSVHYFSPEQARGEPATTSSDIYSLGIVQYELLTGRRPWEGDSAAAVAMARLSGAVPDPASIRAGIPSDLAAIDRRALALAPIDRWSSAAHYADALDAYLVGAPIPELAVGAAAAGATTAAAAAAVAGTAAYAASARSNPQAEPMARPIAPPPDDEEDARTSPAVWAAAFLALGVLVLVGFILFQFLSGGSTTTVTVPSFVDMTLTQAQAEAQRLGITVVPDATASSDKPVGTILSQDPPAGSTIDKGSTVNVTVAQGTTTVAVPDLRGKTEAQAVLLLTGVGLIPGAVTQVFDPVQPAGLIAVQEFLPGTVVATGTPVGYGISQGPEPSASPSPSPSPSPTPTASPTPTPTPPPPTPTPPPGPRNVGNYSCATLEDATATLEGDGFTLGDVTGEPDGYTPVDSSVIIDQSPGPGTNQDFGTPIDLTVTDPALSGC